MNLTACNSKSNTYVLHVGPCNVKKESKIGKNYIYICIGNEDKKDW